MRPLGFVDAPVKDELVYQHGFEVQGWARAADGRPWKAIVVRAGSELIGSTALRFSRPDVAAAHGADMMDVGFVVRCTVPEALRATETIELRCEIVDADGNAITLDTRPVRFSNMDYRMHGHGYVLTDGPTPVLVRDQVYGSGPPSPIADSRCVDLVMRYVRSGDSVLDVGCGIGAYYHALLPYGVDWTGCETRADFVDHMHAQGLRAVHVTDGLPFADQAFDATICIEVLEHVADYERFLAEISRVCRRTSVFSVPNFAAIPVSSSFYALPWHMLESDHKNFFTTRSLESLLKRFYAHVETFEYGPLPALHSPDGIAINNHVFAVAQH